MKFLDQLFSAKSQPSKKTGLAHDRRFANFPIRMFPTPTSGRMDVRQGFPPLVKFAGTFWHFRVHGRRPSTFIDGQRVKILGRQGNCLLIELETSND